MAAVRHIVTVVRVLVHLRRAFDGIYVCSKSVYIFRSYDHKLCGVDGVVVWKRNNKCSFFSFKLPVQGAVYRSEEKKCKAKVKSFILI